MMPFWSFASTENDPVHEKDAWWLAPLMKKGPMKKIRISRHAADQYRHRVLGCPERGRGDEALKRVISAQLRELPIHQLGGDLVAEAGLYRFVIQDGAVVTTLGYRMRASKKKSKKAMYRGIPAGQQPLTLDQGRI